MSRAKKSGPSTSELKLRADLDRARRDLQRLRKEGDATPAESPTPPGALTPAQLEQRVTELELAKERLSKLYFTQLDENRRRSSRLHEILRVVTEIGIDRDFEALLQRIAETIQGSLGFRIVFVRLRKPGSSQLEAAASAGLAPTARAALNAQNVLLDDFLSWRRDEFKVSRSYFIAHKHAFSHMLPAGFVPDLGPREEWEWHPEDVLLVPLVDGRGEPLGYISVDDPVDRMVPSQETIELLEVFASHAVVAIENARLYGQLAQRTRDLEEADRRMREMDDLKRQFISTVSHELRTPLTAIRVYLDTLMATGVEGMPPERFREFLGVVDDESERLSRLIESVLDLGQFDSGNRRARRQAVELAEVVAEAVVLLRRMAEARGVELKVQCEVADTRLEADRDQLRQMVLHLTSNAIKFTPAGGSVALRVGANEESVKLEVEDTGIGIPEEALEKIFDRFYQVDSSLARRYGGSGLGLAICKSIVDWHGGRVSARSQPGSGSSFTVVLPRRRQPRVLLRSGSELSGPTRDVLRLGVEMVSEVMDSGVVSLMSAEPDGSLVIQAAIGLEPQVVSEARVLPGVGVAGWVADHRRPICASAPDQGEVRGSGRERYQTGTFLSVPLESPAGLLGVINVTDPGPQRPFHVEDCHLLLELADAIAHAWRGALDSEARQAGLAGTTDALRTVLEHVRQGRRRAPERVRLAQAIAHLLGLKPSEAALVAFAATVHDVGMTLVDREIVEGAEPLTDDQRAEVRQHVELGDEVLGRLENMGTEMFERLETMGAVREIVMSHHEWWDGTGYPRGLSGTAIPTGARVLAVVDAYESLTTGRPHRPACSPGAAFDEIQKLRGTQFDPDVVDALARFLAQRSVDQAPVADDSASSEARR